MKRCKKSILWALVLLLSISNGFLDTSCISSAPNLVGDECFSLNGVWNLSNSANSRRKMLALTANVPGDLISDLVDNEVLPNPLHDNNFKKNREIWSQNTWIYSRSLELPKLYSDYIVAFDGIKMGASVMLDSQLKLNATNQFRRFWFHVDSNITKTKKIDLSVQFDPEIDTGGRFSAFSGGWDWAPYTRVYTNGSLNPNGKPTKVSYYTKGIISNVTLIGFSRIALESVAVIVNSKENGYFVLIKIAIFCGTLCSPCGGKEIKISVKGEWDEQILLQQTIQVNHGVTKHSLSVNVSSENLMEWTLGSPKLYNLQIIIDKLSISRKIGFRRISLITSLDPIPHAMTGNDTFIIELNGVPLMARGANIVPSHIFEANYNFDGWKNQLLSAKVGNMNILRVWGGGTFLPESFYTLCDEMGILIYQDLMLVEPGHLLVEGEHLQSLLEEITYNIRRLSHHPSVILYSGCNECNLTRPEVTQFIEEVFSHLISEDSSRIIWPGSPSRGWATGVSHLGLSNGENLTVNSGESLQNTPIEIHGPYIYGSGFAAVNGASTMKTFASGIPLVLNDEDFARRTGRLFRGQFVSEFGCVGGSSFQSFSKQVSSTHWSLDGNASPDICIHVPNSNENNCIGENILSERNYPCHNIIATYFGDKALNSNLTSFEKQLFLCQLGQYLKVQAMLDEYLKHNIFGLLLWQLNDVWSTFGWGSLEYPDFSSRHVSSFPRWKPVHYLLRDSFTGIYGNCGVCKNEVHGSDNICCFVRNDFPFVLNFVFKVSVISTSSSETLGVMFHGTSLKGPSKVEVFRIHLKESLQSNTVLKLEVEADHDDRKNYSFTKWVLLKNNLNNSMSGNTVRFLSVRQSTDSTKIVLRLSATKLTMFVTLVSEVAGWFSENVFTVMSNEEKLIYFNIVSNNDLTKEFLRFTETVKIYHW